MQEWSVDVANCHAHSGPRFAPPGPFGRTNGEVGHRNADDLRAKLLVLPRRHGSCEGCGVVGVVGANTGEWPLAVPWPSTAPPAARWSIPSNAR